MKAYYNENDPRAAAWLRALISQGSIMAGEVDERSIADVQPTELTSFRRCHFFSGIAGWEYALQLADWPDDRLVWTGSCPCQPFSSAGKGGGFDDERHLWPQFYRLIEECRPATVFGEQVASPLGRAWLNGVFADMETSGYAVAGADIPACSIGAPHIRQRLYWVGHSNESGWQQGQQSTATARYGRSAFADGGDGGMGNAEFARLEGHGGHEHDGDESRWLDANAPRPTSETGGDCFADFWGNYRLVHCADGKTRRIESALEPLVDGFPNRVAVLRGLGNAIVPALAAEFIQAYREAIA